MTIQARKVLSFGWFVSKVLPDDTVLFLVGFDPCHPHLSEWTADIQAATMFPDASTANIAMHQIRMPGAAILRLSREAR